MTRTARREFTKADKLQMVKRASDARGNIFCEGCGLNVTGKAIEFDHVIAESHRHPDDLLKPLTIADGQLLGRDCCHRAPGGKTSSDTTVAAKLKRLDERNKGIKRRSGRPLPGSKTSPFKIKLNGEVVRR
jgi:hypothetical protein